MQTLNNYLKHFIKDRYCGKNMICLLSDECSVKCVPSEKNRRDSCGCSILKYCMCCICSVSFLTEHIVQFPIAFTHFSLQCLPFRWQYVCVVLSLLTVLKSLLLFFYFLYPKPEFLLFINTSCL